jgi:hypothetical protein
MYLSKEAFMVKNILMVILILAIFSIASFANADTWTLIRDGKTYEMQISWDRETGRLTEGSYKGKYDDGSHFSGQMFVGRGRKVIYLVQKNAVNFYAVYSGIKIAHGTFEGKFFATSNSQEHTFKIIVEAARK